MTISAPIANTVDDGLPIIPEQVDDPKAFAEFMLVYRAIKNLAAYIANYYTPKVWTAGADLVLGIGQSVSVSATAATSIPLHVACGNGQIYEMELNGTYTQSASTVSILQLNNVAPATDSFKLYQVYGNGATGTAVTNYVVNIADGGFRFDVSGGLFNGIAKIFTSTLNKAVIAHSAGGVPTTQYISYIQSIHNDTTTVWSSLGTVIMPNAWTGTITVRRLA